MATARSYPTSPTPAMVARLGYGGLIPFAGLAIGTVGGGIYAGPCGRALLAYGAVILSFVGALHWGFAMSLAGLGPGRRDALWLWSIVPALMAWVSLMAMPVPGTIVLLIGFLAQYVQDHRLARASNAIPSWYLPLRVRLTGVACLCLLVGAVSARV